MANELIQPNSDYETTFDEVENLAGISHKGQPNRTIATAARRGLKSFAAVTEIVQWGQYDGEPAVLLVMSLIFAYEPGSNDRIVEASIKITLEQVKDKELTKPPDLDPDNNPIVKRIGPERWETEIHSAIRAPIAWRFDPEVSVGGLSARLGSVESEWRRRDVEHSMELRGNKTSDDTYGDFNGAVWQVFEDKWKKAGIVNNFRIALIAQTPKDPPYPFVARISVIAKMASWYNRPLKSENDAPVFFDRMTPKPIGRPRSYGEADQDFADEAFPWDEIGLSPPPSRP